MLNKKNCEIVKNKKELTELSILCWNIANPSQERAGKQATWLLHRTEDVLILTETKNSKGCALIEKHLKAFGYNILFVKPEEKEYGVVAISRHKLIPTKFFQLIEYLPSRVVSFRINKLEIIGTYVPSRGFDEKERLSKKKYFLKELSNALEKRNSKNRQIFCGDLNVLEPNHIPHYKYFKDWEYSFYCNFSKYQLKDVFRYFYPETHDHSWFGHSGNGYRYDHCFVSNDLIKNVKECYYLHEPRKNKLSDHSAMVIRLSFPDIKAS